MNNKDNFKISFGYEEIVTFGQYRNFKVKIDITELITNKENLNKDYEYIQNEVFKQIDKQKKNSLERIEIYNLNSSIINILNEIISILNEEREFSKSDFLNIRKKHKKTINLLKEIKEKSKNIPINNKEEIKDIINKIKFVEGIIKNEFEKEK